VPTPWTLTRCLAGLSAATTALLVLGSVLELGIIIYAGFMAGLLTLWVLIAFFTLAVAIATNSVEGLEGAFPHVVYGIWIFPILLMYAGAYRNGSDTPTSDPWTPLESGAALVVALLVAAIPAILCRRAKAAAQRREQLPPS
jgi:hypothetical protein